MDYARATTNETEPSVPTNPMRATVVFDGSDPGDQLVDDVPGNLPELLGSLRFFGRVACRTPAKRSAMRV